MTARTSNSVVEHPHRLQWSDQGRQVELLLTCEDDHDAAREPFWMLVMLNSYGITTWDALEALLRDEGPNRFRSGAESFPPARPGRSHDAE